MLRALLVDDEIRNLESLEFLLLHDCQGIAVVGKAQGAGEARDFLQANRVDVMFLDISMPGEDGFQLLQSLQAHDMKVVFVTASDAFALKAIKASAVDYLLKPVRIDDLQNAVGKVRRSLDNPMAAEQNELLLRHFLEGFGRKGPIQKIAVPQMGGMKFIALDDIVSLQADSNYTIFHLKDMQKMVVSKTLKDFEELLDAHRFVRIHKSYIINLDYVAEYSTVDGGYAKMSDGNQWSISRRQLEFFLERMKKATMMFGKYR